MCAEPYLKNKWNTSSIMNVYLLYTTCGKSSLDPSTTIHCSRKTSLTNLQTYFVFDNVLFVVAVSFEWYKYSANSKSNGVLISRHSISSCTTKGMVWLPQMLWSVPNNVSLRVTVTQLFLCNAVKEEEEVGCRPSLKSEYWSINRPVCSSMLLYRLGCAPVTWCTVTRESMWRGEEANDCTACWMVEAVTNGDVARR